jgi:quercetin dioxygenase-like cupin family protein
MRVSAVTGAVALCIFEQWCAPGTGEPTHTHPVEEVLTILDGQAEIWLGDDQVFASVGQSVIVPAGIRHGFRNAAAATLHIQGTLASSTFEAFVDGQEEPTRQWLA